MTKDPEADEHAAPVVLVVDDERRSQEAMRRTLEEDFRVLTAGSADEALRLMEHHRIDVLLCDQRMPGVSGVDFLRRTREQWPEAVRMLVSGYTDSQDIIAGINDAGIYQYILKPWAPDHLLSAVREAVEATRLNDSCHRMELQLRAGGATLRRRRDHKLRQLQRAFDFERLVRGPGSPLDAVCADAERLARYDLSVLVLGESGTGKELLARAIHLASPRLAAPFVVVNCGALPDTLLETELFGHRRGAFTGAVEDRVGLFQQAHGGTLFLDEIGETSPAFQVKLLRALQEGEVRPVGAARTVAVDVRVIAATHRQLDEEMRLGRFREDLYWRLAGATLRMPPLRERPGDLLPIAEALVRDVAAELGRPCTGLDDDARAVLLGYPWPGNIRELRNELARALVLSESAALQAQALSPRVLGGQTGHAAVRRDGSAGASRAWPSSGTLQERLDAVEAMMLREVMLQCAWNKSQAARQLGLSRNGLRTKLQRFGLDR